MKDNMSKRTREFVIERATDRYGIMRCEKCNSSNAWGATIDHIINRGMGGTKREYFPEDLQYLCRECHEKKTEHKEK